MPNRRRIGKLEAKLARNFVHQHLKTRNRNNDPDEISETMFTSSLEEMRKYVLTEAGAQRTGEIPDYPQGMVCFDSHDKGFFNVVTLKDEVPIF